MPRAVPAIPTEKWRNLMKRIATLFLLAGLAASGAAAAQSADMKGMDMKGMDMKGMGQAQVTPKNGAVHKMSAVVKAIDPTKGVVTLAHGPVASLKWPAMTMGFTVKDRTLFDRLALGQKVDVEFTKQGSDYVVTAVK
jgi:Cu(I)/Ag(I) efflux system protein CusF